MQFLLFANCLNGSILPPITCRARKGITIISYLLEPINQVSTHHQITVLNPPQLRLLANPNLLPPSSIALDSMSSKKPKITKTKKGVRVMNPFAGSSAVPETHSLSSALVEHQETLDVQPLLHAPPPAVKPKLPQKSFKKQSRYSSRLRNTTKGATTTSSSNPIDIPDDEDVNMAEVNKVVDSVLKSANVEPEKDVIPDATTSGIAVKPISSTSQTATPIVEEPEDESEEESDSEESKEEEAEDASVEEPSQAEEISTPAVQETDKESSEVSGSEESGEEEDVVPVPDPIPTQPREVSDDVLITKSLPDSMAARLKARKQQVKKGSSSVSKSTSTPVTYASRQVIVKKTAPKKDSRKKTVDVKRKRADSSTDEDVGQDVLDIVPPSQKRKMSGKKIPLNIPAAPLDNISFHFEHSAQRWRYVYQRRVARERELHVDALKCKNIISLVKHAGLLSTIHQIGRCFDRLVKEFVVNVGPEVGTPGHPDHHKVFVRGCCVKFSPAVINQFLQRTEESPVIEVSLKKVAQELTAKKVNSWPIKGKLLASQLSVKYAILHKISIANLDPSNHTTTLNANLARMLFAIGTKSHYDFGSYVFEQTLKHGESFAVKMPIAFPSLITELIISQYPDIVKENEEESFKPSPLNFDYRLFVGTHVKDIEDQPAKEAGHSGLKTEPVKEELLSELIDTSKTLQ